jgi:catechol 2,3-dioxygenase-like lactoylglutathione lyase family enzyme
MTLRPNGVHHLALSTGDMKTQLNFFTEVLGMELVALFWMHGVKGAWHSFLKLNDRSYLSFVHMPQMIDLKGQLGLSHSPNAGGASAGGTMQHLALRVDDQQTLLAMRDRIRSHGVQVFGHIDHGMCQSIYFAGPEGINLEIACQGELEPDAWIDPEVVALCGITQDELAAMTSPRPFVRPAVRVDQPPTDPEKPHPVYPDAVYARMLATPDDAFTARFSEPEPPVARPKVPA